jgi:hypothetical protein
MWIRCDGTFGWLDRKLVGEEHQQGQLAGRGQQGLWVKNRRCPKQSLISLNKGFMIQRIVLALALLVSYGGLAQTAPYQEQQGISPRQLEKTLQNWTQGYVVLVTGDTVRCEMNYSPAVSEGLLQVKDDGNILTLSVKEVKAFSYLDQKKKVTRRFYTFPVYDENVSTSREYFLEFIYENPHAAILNHHMLVNKVMGSPYTKGGNYAMIMELKYLLDVHTGKLVQLSKKEAMALMASKRDMVEAYIKENSIKLKNDVEEYIKVLDYYATL